MAEPILPGPIPVSQAFADRIEAGRIVREWNPADGDPVAAVRAAFALRQLQGPSLVCEWPVRPNQPA